MPCNGSRSSPRSESRRPSSRSPGKPGRSSRRTSTPRMSGPSGSSLPRRNWMPVSSGRPPPRCASSSCRWLWSSPGSGWASPGSSLALSGRSTWTGACGSASVAGSWSAWGSEGPATGSSRLSAGSPAWWRLGRTGGSRSGLAGGDDATSRAKRRNGLGRLGMMQTHSHGADLYDPTWRPAW